MASKEFLNTSNLKEEHLKNLFEDFKEWDHNTKDFAKRMFVLGYNAAMIDVLEDKHKNYVTWVIQERLKKSIFSDRAGDQNGE